MPLLYSLLSQQISFLIFCKRQKQFWHFCYPVLYTLLNVYCYPKILCRFSLFHIIFLVLSIRLLHESVNPFPDSNNIIIYTHLSLKWYILHSRSVPYPVLLKRKFRMKKKTVIFSWTLFFCWVSQQLIMYRMLSTKINFDSDYGKILNVCLLQRLDRIKTILNFESQH